MCSDESCVCRCLCTHRKHRHLDHPPLRPASHPAENTISSQKCFTLCLSPAVQLFRLPVMPVPSSRDFRCMEFGLGRCLRGGWSGGDWERSDLAAVRGSGPGGFAGGFRTRPVAVKHLSIFYSLRKNGNMCVVATAGGRWGQVLIVSRGCTRVDAPICSTRPCVEVTLMVWLGRGFGVGTLLPDLWMESRVQGR